MVPDFVGPMIMTTMLIPIVALVVVMVLIIIAMNRNYRIRQMEHQARMKALDKGYDIPEIPTRRKRRGNYPFAWPLVITGFGLALLFMAIFTGNDTETLGFGLVGTFIGAGLIASRFIGVRKEEMERTEHAAQQWRAPETSATSPAEPALDEPVLTAETEEDAAEDKDDPSRFAPKG